MDENCPEKVHTRGAILEAESRLNNAIAEGVVNAVDCPVFHYFTGKHKKYGCHVYVRTLCIPAGTLLIGKIHKDEHIAVLVKGKIRVATEDGDHYLNAPYIVVAEAGSKRVGYAEEDTIWLTIHLTEHAGEENLEKIEDEVIAKSYEQIGFISAISELLGDDQ